MEEEREKKKNFGEGADEEAGEKGKGGERGAYFSRNGKNFGRKFSGEIMYFLVQKNKKCD